MVCKKENKIYVVFLRKANDIWSTLFWGEFYRLNLKAIKFIKDLIYKYFCTFYWKVLKGNITENSSRKLFLTILKKNNTGNILRFITKKFVISLYLSSYQHLLWRTIVLFIYIYLEDFVTGMYHLIWVMFIDFIKCTLYFLFLILLFLIILLLKSAQRKPFSFRFSLIVLL